MKSQRIIKPFLSLPFAKDAKFYISEGAYYSKEETKIHGMRLHRAIDFAANTGTRIYAPASGYAASSYNFAYSKRLYKGERIGVSTGNLMQMWHSKEKVFTMYAHLDSVSDILPFYNGKKNDKVVYSKFYNQPLPEFLKIAKYIKRGTYLGTVGTSGLSLGDTNDSWDEPHLHFAVYTRKRTGKYKDWFDPYGINGKAPSYIKVKSKPIGLWLDDGNNEIMFAK